MVIKFTDFLTRPVHVHPDRINRLSGPQGDFLVAHVAERGHVKHFTLRHGKLTVQFALDAVKLIGLLRLTGTVGQHVGAHKIMAATQTVDALIA